MTDITITTAQGGNNLAIDVARGKDVTLDVSIGNQITMVVDQGIQGSSGTSGYSGISGYSGFSGYSGISGYSSYSGYSGISGFSGFSGKSGYSGISGYSGSGISGYSGYSGSGTSGYSGYSGISGFSGQSGASTSGYSGYSGISGFSGYSGYSGSGVSGYSGSGVSGYSGYSGFSGQSGASTSGYSGYSGISGFSGWSGISGFSGSGVSGYSGYSGLGLSGYSGYSGQSGASTSGYSGYSGFSGYSGSGISGYSGSGISGYSGYSGLGLSGYSGYSGYSGSGISGFSGYSGKSGYSGAVGAGGTIGNWGSFWDTTIQTTTANTPTAITLNSADSNNTGVSVASGSRVTFANAGTYSLIYSLQLTNHSTALGALQVWIKKNGVNISDTNSHYDVPDKQGSAFSSNILTVNYVLQLSANDYIELYWDTTNASVYLETLAGTGTYPETPSVIFTATQVMYTQSGYSGVSGYSGFSGAVGASGLSGFSGISGYSGYSGAAGATGASGYSGYSGVVGASGFSGKSGYSGSGISGYSGYSGSGVSGFSGFSGYSGATGSGGGGISWQSVQTANFTATTGNAYPVDTSSAAITVTLPASPSVGDVVTVLDYAGTSATNNIIVNPNGNKLQGTTFNALISVNRQAYNFVYVDATQGWLSYAQEYNALTQTAPPSGDPYWTDVSLLTNSANELSFADASTNNFAITNTGGVAPSLNTPVTGGGSQYFNGSSYLKSSSSTAFNFGSSDFTIECWAYPTSYSSLGTLFTTADPTDDQGIFLGLNSDGTIQYLAGDGTWQFDTNTTAAVPLNTWSHVAIARSGNDFNVFINGTLVSTTTNSVSLTNTNNSISIGGRAAYSQIFAGYLSNTRVSNSALYTTTFTPPTAPLTAVSGTSLLINCTNQNTFDNATFYDQSANSFAITPSGSPVYSGLSPFGNAYPGSVYVDGSSYLTVTGSNAVPTGSGNYTVEGWINLSSVSSAQILLAGTGSNAFFLRIGTSYGSAANGLNIGRNLVADCEYCSYTFAINTWYHIAVTRSSSVVYFFVNGVQQTTLGSGTSGYSFASVSSNSIGNTYGAEYCNGYFTNIRSVNGTAVYTANFTPPTTPLPTTTNTSLLLGCDTGAFYDLSNVGNPISQSGSPVVTTQVSPFSSVTESYYFDGSSYLPIPNSTSLSFGTGDFTFEGWFYASSLSGSDSIVFSAGNSGFGCILRNNAVITFQSFVAYNDTFSTSLSNNTWYYIAISRTGSTINCYLNGTSIGSASNSTNYAQSTGGAIGADETGGSKFTGYINNLRITKGVARYTANFTPPTAPFPTSA